MPKGRGWTITKLTTHVFSNLRLASWPDNQKRSQCLSDALAISTALSTIFGANGGWNICNAKKNLEFFRVLMNMGNTPISWLAFLVASSVFICRCNDRRCLNRRPYLRRCVVPPFKCNKGGSNSYGNAIPANIPTNEDNGGNPEDAATSRASRWLGPGSDWVCKLHRTASGWLLAILAGAMAWKRSFAFLSRVATWMTWGPFFSGKNHVCNARHTYSKFVVLRLCCKWRNLSQCSIACVAARIIAYLTPCGDIGLALFYG